jgi:hypothetical protein
MPDCDHAGLRPLTDERRPASIKGRSALRQVQRTCLDCATTSCSKSGLHIPDSGEENAC